MSMWALMAAPLFYSGDITRLDAFTLNVLCNAEVIEVDQDPLGTPGQGPPEDRRRIRAREADGGRVGGGGPVQPVGGEAWNHRDGGRARVERPAARARPLEMEERRHDRGRVHGERGAARRDAGPDMAGCGRRVTSRDPGPLPRRRYRGARRPPVASRPGRYRAHVCPTGMACAADPRLLRPLPGDAGPGAQALGPALAAGVVLGRALDSVLGRCHAGGDVLRAVRRRADQGLAAEAPGPVTGRGLRGHADGGRAEPRRGRGDGLGGPGLPPAPRCAAAARRRGGRGPDLRERGIPPRGRRRRRHAVLPHRRRHRLARAHGHPLGAAEAERRGHQHDGERAARDPPRPAGPGRGRPARRGGRPARPRPGTGVDSPRAGDRHAGDLPAGHRGVHEVHHGGLLLHAAPAGDRRRFLCRDLRRTRPAGRRRLFRGLLSPLPEPARRERRPRGDECADERTRKGRMLRRISPILQDQSSAPRRFGGSPGLPSTLL